MTEAVTPTSIAELQPKMCLEGKVTRIELFGAFIDIGLGQAALLHVSQIAGDNVTRVQDALNVGDTVTVWVSKVDAGANRIDLTMKAPLGLDWNDIKAGMDVTGKVVRIEKFGAFVEIGAERPGLLHVSEMAADYVADPRDKVNMGDEIKARIINVDRSKKKIDLSLKVYEVEERTTDKAEQAAALADDDEEIEQVSALAVALQEALNTDPKDDGRSKRENRRRDKRRRNIRDDQEELFSRTLNNQRR